MSITSYRTLSASQLQALLSRLIGLCSTNTASAFIAYDVPRNSCYLTLQPHLAVPAYLFAMADDTGVAEDTSITFTVKSSNDSKFTLTLPASTPVSELKQRLSSSEYADTPAERQRLIYSGRVLKDNETLETYKIKDGHTIHLVKSAASNQQRTNPASPSGSATVSAGATPSQPAAGVPTNLAAGTGNNPLAGLTGARYAGFAQLPGAGLFGPDGGVSKP